MAGHSPRRAPERVSQPVWNALRAAEGPLTIKDLHYRTDAGEQAVFHRLKLWRRAGLVHRIEGRPHRYAMLDVKTCSATPPSMSRDGRATPKRPARDCLWSAIRVLKRFDLPTVKLAAGVSRAMAKTYVSQLERGGYLRRVRQANPRLGEIAIYAIVRDTGPRAPSPTRRGTAWALTDANTGAEYDLAATPAAGGVS